MIIKRQDIHSLFHLLWTKAVGVSGYDKQLWIELETKLIKLIEEADNPPTELKDDWTSDGRGSNNSELYNKIAGHVEALIRNDAHALIGGRADATARVIVSQLAHVHGFRPPGVVDSATLLSRYRLALTMIRAGCLGPATIAANALSGDAAHD